MIVFAPIYEYPLVFAKEIHDCSILQFVFIGCDGPYYKVHQTQGGDIFWTFNVVQDD
jgi:hypothetical protein